MSAVGRSWLAFGAACLVVLGLAAWLRASNAELRQFHADEGVQAYQAWQLAESGEYRYDPSEHHGPSLYYFTDWLYPFLEDESGSVSDFALRLVPIGFGLASILFGMWAWRRYGAPEALLWGLLAALAPIAIIYQAYFVQESLLAFFSLLALYFVFRYLEGPRSRWAVAIGLAVGAMHVTKETAVIHASAIALSAVVLRILGPKDERLKARLVLRHAALAFVALAVLHVLFFSSFFAHPGGVVDAVASYFHYADRAQGQGHEKGFLYYLGLLWPHSREGVGWGELAFLCSVALGLVMSIASLVNGGGEKQRFWAFASLFGLVLLLMYSIIPYKTPWLLLTPYLALAYAAAGGLVHLLRLAWGATGVARLAIAASALALSAWLLVEQSSLIRQAVFRYHSATRNPYLYQHTTSRYGLLVDRLQELLDSGDVSAGVYSPDAAWPLPWHLRDYRRVGYWSSLEQYEPRAVDVFDTRLLSDALPAAGGDDVWELYGLRPNTLMSVRISAEILPPVED